jgi:transcriptional regulator with XRE-family HTH domain
VSTPAVGVLVRDWRTRRRRTQLDLSLDVGVSTRHLSFVETGRSRPSPELVLALAEHLDVPLRERNRMLVAAGYAPRYSERSLDDPAMGQVRASLQRMIDAHHPYPGVVIDRRWDVVLANGAALALIDGLPAHVLQPAVNVFRLCLHPDGLAPRTRNLGDWANYLLRQVRRTAELTGDPRVAEVEQELLAYPNLAGLPATGETGEWDDPPLLVPLELEVGDLVLSLFTTLTTFGTPRDVTVEELCVELFFPADDATEVALRGA